MNHNQLLLDSLKKIKLIIYDVDGIMTDGRIIIGNQDNDEIKHFNVKDGLGIKLLSQIGIKQVILTGKSSKLVEKRFSKLNLDAIFQGKNNKVETLETIIKQFGISPEQMLMVGDDLPDLPIIKRCGIAITVQDAHPWVKEHANYITDAKGGHGAVREICDLILTAHELKKQVIEDFIEFGEANINVL